MITSEKLEFVKLLKDTAEVYTKILSDSLLATYWKDLADYHFVDIRNAIDCHRRDPKAGQFMPKPADLIKILKEKKWHTAKSGYQCRIDFCTETKNLIRIGFDESPVHWCLKHYEQRRKKSDIDLEIERVAKQFEDRAKESGVTNQKMFEHHFGFDLKRAAQIMGGAAK